MSDETTLPPALVYLPPLFAGTKSTGPRIAEMMAMVATRGPGTFAVENLPLETQPAGLTDGRRITQVGGQPQLDIFTFDYTPLLAATSDRDHPGLLGKLRNFVRDGSYTLLAFTLTFFAPSRAKSCMARIQLLFGLGAVLLMVITTVFTGFTVWNAVTSNSLRVALPLTPENWDAAVVLGLTGVVAFCLARIRPVADRMTTIVGQLLEYVMDERVSATISDNLHAALDPLLDEPRPIYLFGYSFGGLVAVDYLFPRRSMRMNTDTRVGAKIQKLVTVGCPLDVVRLYRPRYLKQREALVPKLDWYNVFIPADVFGSNFRDRKDDAEEPPTEVSIDGEHRVSHRYTEHRLDILNLFLRRGFVSHGEYWGEPGQNNCLPQVMAEIGMPTATVAHQCP